MRKNAAIFMEGAVRTENIHLKTDNGFRKDYKA
jgi:hypothetical protein